MRNLNGLPLDDDVIDRILQFLPSFSTLYSAILTSKSFYQVYKAHPRSIIRAVAYNVVGPALPQALRAIRYQEHKSARGSQTKVGVDDSETESDSDDNETPTRPSDANHAGSETESDDDLQQAKTSQISRTEDDEETDEKTPITPDEARQLCESAKIVDHFEDLFSLRHKNRRFKTSQLTPTESYHFHRATYRIMLYSRVFNAKKYEEWDETEEDEVPADELRQVRQARKKFLRNFFSPELLQIHTVSLFLLELINWAGRTFLGETENSEFILAMGPTTIFHFINDTWGDTLDEEEFHLTNPFCQSYLSGPISQVLEERKSKLPDEGDPSVWRHVLESIDGDKDPCDQCKTPTGFDLLGPSTYDFVCRPLDHPLSSHVLPIYLKGNLPRSLVDRNFMEAQIRPPYVQETPYARITDTIFDDDIKQPEFIDWRKEDWLCARCMEKYLREHLHLWLLSLKKIAGETVPENCWYGYNCRTMTHKIHHAQKLNHLCAPTRGT
ncbi:hypothetical protein VKT23_003455 [Stygiomarasmius scandens]|uniref:F-box domain-containing protein n=1 Tax=Marasmiellus scandens TaxID=2682957 RepID=A0ABR1K010_9AGAR